MLKTMIFATMMVLLMFVFVGCGSDPVPLASPVPDVEEYDLELEYEDEHYTHEDEFQGWDDGHSMLGGFARVTGEVVEIDVHGSGDDMLTFFRLQGDEGNATFLADFSTFFLGDEPVVGDVITGFYSLSGPMAMIYPPQYNVLVIVNGDSHNVMVDRFDDDLVSYDGSLQLNIDSDTEISLQNGDPIRAGELAHRMLVVVYDVSTRSIPAITTPSKVVVLFEQIATGPAILDDWDDVVFYDIIIDGVGLPGVYPRFSDDNDLFPSMVPLVLVGFHLGYDVFWDVETNVVSLEGLNGPISFEVGSNYFTVADESIALPQPSMEIDGNVYVPVLFFRDVYGMEGAYSIGGQIFIETYSDME